MSVVPTVTPVATPLGTPVGGIAASPVPVRVDADACAIVRALLTQARFDEESVSARLGGNTMFAHGRLLEGRTTLSGPVGDVQAALIRLLVDSETMAVTDARRWLGEEPLAALETLG